MNEKQMVKKLEKGFHPMDLAIEKWEDILTGKGTDIGGANCALCHYYHTCDRCPVFLITHISCLNINAPYKKWFSHQVRQHGIRKVLKVQPNCNACKTFAGNVVKNLKRVRKIMIKHKLFDSSLYPKR